MIKTSTLLCNVLIAIPRATPLKTKRLSSLSFKQTPGVFKGFAFDKWI